MKCTLLLLCVTATAATKFTAGQAPSCHIDSAGRTIVHYDSRVHDSFKCTHVGNSCSCTLTHPTHHAGRCKQLIAPTLAGTVKTHSFHGDCSASGRNPCERLSPCQNGGTCTNNDQQYSCACTSHWQGTNCETPKFGGTCANGSLVAVPSRTRNNHCGSCNAGYRLKTTTTPTNSAKAGVLSWGGWGRDGTPSLNAHCEGDCDANHQCANGGKCMHDLSTTQLKAYGCSGTKYSSSAADYCIVQDVQTTTTCELIWTGSCSNGSLIAPKDRTQNNHCGSCNTGYKISGKSCVVKYTGSCSNGYLIAVASRTQNNHCGSCKSGYKISGTSCVVKYSGRCSNGYLIAVASRTQNNHCGSCKSAYYLSSRACHAFGGSCSNGSLIAQASRRQHNHCGSCNNGYFLSGRSCSAYGGGCSNGYLVTQTSRRQHNHCGSCKGGYYLSNRACHAYTGSCPNGNLITQTSRRQHNHCGYCHGGYYLGGDRKCHGYGGSCNNGSLITQSSRRQTNHCGSCNGGYKLENRKCIVKCNPSWTANCWYRGSTVVNCASNQYWDGSNCQGCPAYSRCNNGIITMKTVRSTYRHGGSATQTFYFPGVNFNQCRLRVDARQTDYDWHHEWLSIRHVDNSYQNLATRCGFNQQCHQNLARCSLSTNTVYVDHGANDQITIQGVNARATDYCPYSPTRDGWPHNRSRQSRQGWGACGQYGTGGDCYYLWAEVTLEQCW